jgi:outer membrane protein assembly factor BamB
MGLIRRIAPSVFTALAFGLCSEHVFGAQEVRFLRQVGEFYILPDVQLSVRDLREANGALYFLISARENAVLKNQIVVVDSDGKKKVRFDVSDGVTGFSVTPSLGVVTQSVVRGISRHRFDEYSASGRLLDSRESVDGFITFWHDGDAITGYGLDRRLYVLRPASPRALVSSAPVLPAIFRVQKLPTVRSETNLAAIVNAASGNLQLLDTSTGEVRSLTISSPELEAARLASKADADRWKAMPATEKSNRDLATMSVVFATAVDSRGEILLAIGAYRVAEGTPVIRVSQDGAITGRFRFDLFGGKQAIDPASTKPFAPLAMAFVNGKLFVTDGNGKVIVLSFH